MCFAEKLYRAFSPREEHKIRKGLQFVSFAAPSILISHPYLILFLLSHRQSQTSSSLFKMLFLKLIPIALVLPAFLLASPAARPAPVPETLPSPGVAQINQLLERQTTSLTTILSDLTSSLGAIEQLLSAQSLNNIEAVVTDLSTLLSAPTTNQTKALLGTASDLLDSPAVSSLISQLPNLLGSVSGLLTPTLITNLTDILGAAHILLTPQFATETAGLINDVAPVSLPIWFNDLNHANSF
jgi:hypothetical protein